MTEPGIDQCGPGWASRYVWQGPDRAWVNPCREHDRRYTLRSGTRAGADRQLLAGLLERSRNRFQRAVAWSYYLAVRAFGWMFWHSGLNRERQP